MRMVQPLEFIATNEASNMPLCNIYANGLSNYVEVDTTPISLGALKHYASRPDLLKFSKEFLQRKTKQFGYAERDRNELNGQKRPSMSPVSGSISTLR